MFTKLLALIATIPMLLPASFCNCGGQRDDALAASAKEQPVRSCRCTHHRPIEVPVEEELPCPHSPAHDPACPSADPVSLDDDDNGRSMDQVVAGNLWSALGEPSGRGAMLIGSALPASASERPLFLVLGTLLI